MLTHLKSEIRNKLEDENCFEVDAATRVLKAGMFESELNKARLLL